VGRLAQEERDQYCDKGGGAQSGDLHAVPGEELVGTGFRNGQTRKRGDREQDDRQSEEGDENGADRTGGLLVPPRVRLTLTVRDEDGKDKTYTTQAKIFLTQPLDF